MLLFQIVQIVYWLALSTWFGSVLFIAVSAPVIFRTVRESDPVLPEVLSVNLEGQHATLLAGSIVGNLLSRLAVLQLVCGGVLLVAMVVQMFVIDLGGNNLTAAVLRGALLVAAVGLVVFDWRVVWPRIWQHREEYIRHADDPEVANPAKEQFDRAHRTSVNLLSGVLFLLLGIVLFSGSILPRPEERALPAARAASVNDRAVPMGEWERADRVVRNNAWPGMSGDVRQECLSLLKFVGGAGCNSCAVC